MSRVLQQITNQHNFGSVTWTQVTDYCPECGQFYPHWVPGAGTGPMRSSLCEDCWSVQMTSDRTDPPAHAINDAIGRRADLLAGGDYGAQVAAVSGYHCIYDECA